MYSDAVRSLTAPYLVTLRDAPEVPAAVRIAAETRFALLLERSLGTPEQVGRVLRAWTAAAESSAEELDRQTVELAVLWPRAFDLARQAALRELGESPRAYFDVELPNH